MNDKDYKSALNQVNYLGSAHTGTHHFWYQRITSVALIVLGIWFAYSLFATIPASYLQVLAWVKNPINTLCLLSLVIIMIFHGQLGLQIIIEDYIPNHTWRVVWIGLLKLLSFGLILMTIIAFIRIQTHTIPHVTKFKLTTQEVN